MVDIKELYKKCLNNLKEPVITAQDVSGYVESPFKVWCECFAPEKKKDPVTRFQKHLFAEGRQHERRIIEEGYPDAERIEYVTPEEGFWSVLEAMRDGKCYIGNAPVFYLPEGIKGRIDLLERNDMHGSAFGPYHYVVDEIKLAKNVQDVHRVQAEFYNYLLSKIQDYFPPLYYIINGDCGKQQFGSYYSEIEGQTSFNDSEEDELFSEIIRTQRDLERGGVISNILSEIRKIKNGEQVPPPIYDSVKWTWRSFCNEEAMQRGDISLICRNKETRHALIAKGYTDISKIANARVIDLLSASRGRTGAYKLIRKAKALTEKTHIKLKDVELPIHSTEIFLDYEYINNQLYEGEAVSMVYLIGALIRKNREEKYIPFIAHDFNSEEKMFNEFLGWLSKQKDYKVYHWSYPERTYFVNFAKKYGMPSETCNAVIKNFTDLLILTRKSVIFPTCTNSLKDIAKYIGFRWRQDDIDANESMPLYFEYVKNPEENEDLLQKILDYNEDDCQATKVVKDWLVTNC